MVLPTITVEDQPHVPGKPRARRARIAQPKLRRPLGKVRALSARAARGRTVPQPAVCKPMPPAGQDSITGWFMYNCGGGVLLVPTPRCVGPECRGGSKAGTPVLGYAGELDAGSKGSFMTAGRLAGVTKMDGVEIQGGLAAIDDLRQRNEIDAYYAGAAKRAYLGQLNEEGDREQPFEAPSPFGRILAPGALGKRYKGKRGADVGVDVDEACGCTPRPFDARDVVSGWGIYYIGTGVLLTPTEKCIAGGGRRPSFFQNMWRNTLALIKPAPPVPPQPAPIVPGAPPVPPAPVPPPINPAPTVYLCMDPRLWPAAWRPQSTPCEAPKISYPG